MRQLEKIDCPFCGKNESQFWAVENGYTMVKCSPCGLVYLNPRPVLATISEAAKTGLHETDSGKRDVVGSFDDKKVDGYRQRILELYPNEELKNKDIRWLDVGCGFGEMLLGLKAITGSGSILEGIEPCNPKVEDAQKRGLNVTSRYLNELEDKYDIISMFNVFSHLPNPEEFIDNLKQLLKPQGEIVLITGNLADIPPETYFESFSLPNHLVFAGERHVLEIFERVGFEVVKVNRYPHWLPRKSDLSFLPDNMQWLKDLIRKAMGRPSSPFRSLYVRARLKTAN